MFDAVLVEEQTHLGLPISEGLLVVLDAVHFRQRDGVHRNLETLEDSDHLVSHISDSIANFFVGRIVYFAW